MASKRPAIPSVPPADPATHAFNSAVKENIELLTGMRNPQNLVGTAASTGTAAINSGIGVAGTPGISIILTNYAAILLADSSGVVSSYAPANGRLYVFAGGVDVTATCTLSVFSQTNCTGTINTATNTPVGSQPMGYYQVTAVSASSATLVLQAIYGFLTLQTTFSISKALGGATGAPGTGTGAVTLVLSNVAIILPAYANGTVTTYGTANGTAKMFDGSTDVTASTTFSAVAVNCTGTINTAINTPVASQPKGYYQITAMSADTATFTVTGVYSGNTIAQVVNLTLAKGGYEIVSTLPSTNLFQGRIVFYTIDNKLYRYDGGAWVTWVQASDVTGQITAAQIQDSVITTAKLLPGLSPVILVTSLPAFGIAGRIVYLTADQQLYRDTGTAWTLAVPAVNITGTIVGSQIGVAAVSTANLVVAGVGAALNDDPGFTDPTAWTPGGAVVSYVTITDGAAGVKAIQTTGVANDHFLRSRSFNVSALKSYRVECWARLISGTGTVYMRMHQISGTGVELAYSTGYEGITPTLAWVRLVGAVTPAAGSMTAFLSLDLDYPTSTGIIQIQDFRCTEMVNSDLVVPNSITTNLIAANSINAGHMQANSITSGSMAANSITGDRIVAGSLNAAKIAAGSITASQMAANSITAGQIQAGAVVTNAMSANSINGDRITAGTLAATAIFANSITAAQIAANAISALAIQAGTITADKLQVGSITGAQIAATTITAVNIAAGTLTAAQIQAGSITGNRIAGTTITGDKLVGGTITGDKIQANAITAAQGQIAALTVNTLQLAGNAVTVPAGAISGVATSGAGVVAVCSPAVSTDGTFPFIINALIPPATRFGSGGGFVTATGNIRRSTVARAIGSSATGLPGSPSMTSTVPNTLGSPLITGNFQTGLIPMMWLDSPPAGTYFYVIACTDSPAGAVINVLGVKK